jgi:C4-dicarboxylate-specific signal transduction histidine kinase
MSEVPISPLGVLLAVAAGVVPVCIVLWIVMWWLDRRDRRRWELQAQLREMEQAIYEETLPEHQREWRRQHREEQAEITREARRRLGLPEEERDENRLL